MPPLPCHVADLGGGQRRFRQTDPGGGFGKTVLGMESAREAKKRFGHNDPGQKKIQRRREGENSQR